MKSIYLSICLMFFTSIAFSQYKVVEQVKSTGAEIEIPFTKYELDNGLTVVIHEDHSDPIVHVDVTYHVGSAREEIGKSGFAHFFEHMMFQGSDNVADEEHFKIVSDSGGTLNGSTNRDRTNYYETLPSNQLATGLWLEADRMGFLLDAVTQKKFEIQRSTVKNERGQNYDNRPYGLASETIAKNLYPYGHPYSWLTIGYIEDLDRVNVEDLKNFFLRWYGPNNATLTLAGDIDQKETMDMVVKYFGSIPRGPEVDDMDIPLPELSEDRYVSYTDNYAQSARIYMVWPVPPRFHEDEAPLDALAEIIGQGKNSIFYKNIVKPKAAPFASTFNSASELSGEFTLIAQAFPTTSLEEIENLFREALKEFEETGVDEEALERFKSSNEANLIRRVRQVSGKASTLASYETFAGDPDYIQKDLERVNNVTKEDVMRVYNKYIKNKPAIILSILPKDTELEAAAMDNFERDTTMYSAPDYGYDGLVYNKATDDFDRSSRPKGGEAPVIKVPDYDTYNFKNGIEVLQTEYTETPETIMYLMFQGGHYLSANDKGKAGIASIFTSMMNEGTEKYTAEEFTSELDKLGSRVSISSGNESINVLVESLNKNLDATIELLNQRLMHPNFTQEDLDRIKQSQLQGIEDSKKNPAFIASVAYDKLLFGQDDIRAIPTSGTKETVESITLQDVEKYYENISPKGAQLVVVSSFDKDEIAKKVDFLKGMTGKEVKMPKLSAPKDVDRTVLYLVDVEGAAQSQIRVGYPIDIPYDATGDYYKLGLTNYSLGGAFNSRINLNLREDKGWTYGARSGFSSTKIPGQFTASAGVKKEATDSSIVEFMNEIGMFNKDGVEDDEIQFMKNAISQSEAREYETPYQKLGLLIGVMRYDLPKGYNEEQAEILKGMTKAEINQLAKKYLDPEKMMILTVGDKKEILPGLIKLGYPIVEIDADGNTKVSN